jgi:3-methyl-2-oxobutanoate hydroxymethyltransferase
LTPQSVNTLGGYRVQGRTDSGAQQLMQDALQLEKAGAQMLVLEMLPAALSGDITRALTACATIGIGAGVDTAGQILVLHDMLGATQGKVPKFAHNFMNEAPSIQDAMHAFVRAVWSGGPALCPSGASLCCFHSRFFAGFTDSYPRVVLLFVAQFQGGTCQG